jgi:hypothetical protein
MTFELDALEQIQNKVVLFLQTFLEADCKPLADEE